MWCTVSSVHASSSSRCGGSEATPWEASVRRRSTGSPPAPTSFSSASSDVITSDNLTLVMDAGTLELVRDFVNSYDVEEDRDEIESWLAEQGLDVPPREAV